MKIDNIPRNTFYCFYEFNSGGFLKGLSEPIYASVGYLGVEPLGGEAYNVELAL